MKTAAKDRLILVSSRALLAELSDIGLRRSVEIEDKFHAQWFADYRESKYFFPPAAWIDNGLIQYINGRHRTVLLCRHLEQLPFLIGNMDMDHVHGKATPESKATLKRIMISELTDHYEFDLPSLGLGDFPDA